ncbi:EXONUCLEASE [Biomphalaria pfeifferi]|uniref:EXONUCLEASE n=1 Tax=Biomphalaria pfeifferi TaxID=112525 RepID=A0AAD8ETV6_BIOPF|nr:EXONUCLEASE [Biomphalaria pfeifferi]
MEQPGIEIRQMQSLAMGSPKELRRLRIDHIQRMLRWIFNSAKRPSFLPLRAKDRPSAINMVRLTSAQNMSRTLRKFGSKYTARINEKIPFEIFLDCLFRDGCYETSAPCLDFIKTENLEFIPTVEFETLYSSGIYIDSRMSLEKPDLSRYRRAHGASAHDIVALDVEKVLTAAGKELGRVTVVSRQGEAIYDKIIRPENPVVDYLTRYSGLTREIIESGIDVQVARDEILELIGPETVIVGHGVENDLSSLELYHDRIIDTAHLFLNPDGRKISLAQLSKKYLNKVIQKEAHDSRIDALTCLHLLSIKVQHMISVTSCKSRRIDLKAEIASTSVADLLSHEEGHLKIACCSHRELKKLLKTYRRNEKCLWMFLYTIDSKMYISF